MGKELKHHGESTERAPDELGRRARTHFRHAMDMVGAYTGWRLFFERKQPWDLRQHRHVLAIFQQHPSSALLLHEQKCTKETCRQPQGAFHITLHRNPAYLVHILESYAPHSFITHRTPRTNRDVFDLKFVAGGRIEYLPRRNQA